MGGENTGIQSPVLKRRGSSPRGRGKPGTGDHLDPRTGLIPAWAGKTRSPNRPRLLGRAHPRVGGENGYLPLSGHQEHWLIPAWAGKTLWNAGKSLIQGAHPRVGGENDLIGQFRQSTEGSSPRGRGKLGWPDVEHLAHGLIPAWAGKTLMPSQTPDQSPAHPRVGGENDWTDPKAPLMPGSSPRGRGKQPLDLMRYLIRRLIPAWAGKTLADNWEVLEAEAHPRVGGENHLMAITNADNAGSSPRGRGKPNISHTHKVLPRLIPAWAGKTRRAVRPGNRRTAHPRVGGENLQVGQPIRPGCGSSPRGRGKRRRSTRCFRRPRLIPAWAGKT